LNTKAIMFLKNLRYTFVANIISLFISTIVILFVPKILGVVDYGYWQLYLFYTLYTALLHFGWIDGVYIRYGGKEYSDLDKRLFFSQFWMLLAFQLLITVCIFIFSDLIQESADKLFIFKMMVCSSLLVIPRGFLQFIMLATNRIKENSQIVILEKIIYFTLILFLLVFRVEKYQLMVVADIIGKLVSLFFAFYYCNDIVFRRISSFYFDFKETILNIRVGIKISLAFIASTLVVGIVRFGIEWAWDVETFGKVSLTLSISSLMLTFLNAVGLVLFPMLRRTEENKLSEIYRSSRILLTTILFGVLLLYFPLKHLLFIWLPHYQDSLMYMALLFPICVFEGQTALLINTYLKTLRKENLILSINILTLVISLIFTSISVAIFKNLHLAVLSIVLILAFRAVLGNFLLSRLMSVDIRRYSIIEGIVSFIFILTAWFIGSWLGMIIYLFIYGLYLLKEMKMIKLSVKKFIRLIMIH
jgi:O-antigen/teichoic acid export membrane protein